MDDLVNYGGNNLYSDLPAIRTKAIRQRISVNGVVFDFYPVMRVTTEDPETGELVTEQIFNSITLGCGCIVSDVRGIAGICEAHSGVGLPLVCPRCLTECYFCGKKLCSHHKFVEAGVIFCMSCYAEYLQKIGR